MTNSKKTSKKLSDKKLILIIAAIVLLVGSFFYFRAMIRKGVWYSGYFLYEKQKNQWRGNVDGEELSLTRSRQPDGTKLAFKRGNITKEYLVIGGNSPSERLGIYEQDTLIFEGTLHDGFLLDKDGHIDNIIIVTAKYEGEYKNGIPADHETKWYPTNYQIAELAVNPKITTRGQPVFLLLAVLFLGILATDIISPDLFFRLRHSLFVENPEPTSFYRAMQAVGRVVLVIAVIAMLYMSFTVN